MNIIRSASEGQLSTSTFAQSLEIKLYRELVIHEGGPEPPKIKDIIDAAMSASIEPYKGLSDH